MRLLSIMWPVIVVLLVLLGPGPGVAAPPVQPESRVLRLAHYDGAARRLGMRDWGTGYDNRQAIHVFLRISERTSILTVGLPPETPRARGERWFRELIDAFKWPGAVLSSNQQPGGLYLHARISGLVRKRDWNRPQSVLNLKVLRTYLARLTPAPAILVVRASGDTAFVSPVPEHQGEVGTARFLAPEERYAFFRLSSPGAASRLTLKYGASTRWQTALGAAAGIWLLLPLAALLAARDQLRRRPLKGEEADRDRLREYRRWHRGILVTTVAGGVTTLFVLGFVRVVMLFGRLPPPMLILVFTVPIAWLLVLGRLIGLPLERRAYPIRASLPWYRAATGELVGASALLLLPLFFTALELAGNVRAAMAFPAWLSPVSAAAFTLGMLALGVGGAIAWSREKWRRRKTGHSREPQVPEDVRAAIHELTARLECPVSRCYVMPTRKSVSGVLAVAVQDDAALVTQDLVEQLRAEQVASLVAAVALTQRISRRDRVIDGLLNSAPALPMLLLVAFMGSLVLGNGRPAGWLMPILMISAMSTGLVAMVSARRTQQRIENADVVVADSFDPPRRFLDTLRQLEELQAATTGMDPGAIENHPVFSRRRTRLQERLGLD